MVPAFTAGKHQEHVASTQSMPTNPRLQRNQHLLVPAALMHWQLHKASSTFICGGIRGLHGADPWRALPARQQGLQQRRLSCPQHCSATLTRNMPKP
jgi:hypothetical protein